MKKHVLFFCTFGLITSLINAQPVLFDQDLSLRSVTKLPSETVRLNYNQVDKTLYFSTLNGDIYTVDITSGTKEKVQSNADHGLSDVQGFDISPDGRFFIVGNKKTTATNTATIKRGTVNEGVWTWETVAITEAYPISNTFFDHIMNGIVVSPSNKHLYVNSGSRTDHGETHTVNGLYPGLRETALTAKILKIPANSTDLFLKNNIDALKTAGYIFAEGVRNSFSLAFDKDGNLFATENAGDRDDPGELNWLQEGNHYGFPWRVGGNNTPMQYPGYNPDEDVLLQPETNAYQQRFFYNDPNYPPPPEDVTFTEPVLNYGPDAVMYRGTTTGQILNATEQDTAISSFTAHRSMLGLAFDANEELGGNYTGDGFSLAFSGDDDDGFFLRWMSDPGKDLLHIELTKNGDNYEMTTTRIVGSFISPIDAELIGNKLYVIEYRNNNWLNVGADTRIWEITFPTKSTTTEPEIDFANKFKLYQNYPNPFNPSTTISFELLVPGFVELTVSDVLGRTVEILVQERMSARTESISFNSGNLPSGVYFYSLSVDGIRIETQRMMLIK